MKFYFDQDLWRTSDYKKKINNNNHNKLDQKIERNTYLKTK